MAKPVFKQQPGNSLELFPVNLFEKIPPNHPVKLVDAVVNGLDLSEIVKLYKGGGASAYEPRMMVKVLFYSYLSNVYSCRKIAKALRENIHFMYLSGNSTPDFRTINNFRGKILKDHIQGLFAQVVKLLLELGYVSLDVQYIDGTKIESCSNRYTFVWRGSVGKYQERLGAKIDKILSEIEDCIASDNQEPTEESLPKAVDTEALKSRLAELNKNLKAPTKQQAKALEKLQKEHLPKLESYQKSLETMGGRNSYSKTDPDATFMRLKDDHMQNGQLKPAYNVQISTENQYLTHGSVHQKPGDTTTLGGHLDGFEEAYGKQSNEVVTDAGYGSEENYELLESKEVEAYVKYSYFHQEQKKKTKENPFLPQNLFYNQQEDFYVCPMGQRMENTGTFEKTSTNGYLSQITVYKAQRCAGCPMRGQCHKAQGEREIQINHRLNELRGRARGLLKSEKGLEHRSKRPIEPEAVFGQMKSNNKFNRFTMRGLEKVTLEFLLMGIGHNLRKMAVDVYDCMQKIKSQCPKNGLLNFLSASWHHIPFLKASLMDIPSKKQHTIIISLPKVDIYKIAA